MSYGIPSEAHLTGASTMGEVGVGKSESVSESTMCGYCSTVDDVLEPI